MPKTTNNQVKLPETDAMTRYPWNQVTHTLGGHEVHFDNTPLNERYRLAHPFGHYEEIGWDGRHLEAHASRHYDISSQGVAKTSEGPYDKGEWSAARRNTWGGIHEGMAGHHSMGGSQQYAHVNKSHSQRQSGENHYMMAGGPASGSSPGSLIMLAGPPGGQGSGTGGGAADPSSLYNHYVGTDGNFVHLAEKSMYLQASDGDFGVHIPKGNFDIRGVANLQIHTQGPLQINSTTMVIIVCGQSRITLTPERISITSQRIDIDSPIIHLNADSPIVTPHAVTGGSVGGGGGAGA